MMRRMSFTPIEEEEMLSTNYRRRSSVIGASHSISSSNSNSNSNSGGGSLHDSSVRSAQSSRVVEFYNGKSVFVTGASGFIGKLLIEKLLRACGNLKRIYVLIRARRGKSASERFEELFSSPIFDNIRASKCAQSAQSEQTNAFEQFIRDKVELLEGELTEPLLGLSEHQLKVMADEVSVVLHSAAIVSFDGKLRRSIRTNLRGTYNVLELASRLPRLASLVHVSTCYSNCSRWEIDEHIYPVEQEPMQVINMAECLDENLVDLLKRKLIGNHPNPYTYTKQLAEYLVGQYGLRKRLPVLICRPSIVVSTLEEPLAGFTDNRNGMNGIFWGMNRALLRTMPGRGGSLADQVPADIVVNNIIALAWFGELYHRVGASLELGRPLEPTGPLDDKMLDYYRERQARLANKLERDDSLRLLKHRELVRVPVCHVSSGVENPVSFHEMLDHVAAGGRRYPSVNLFREPRCRFSSNSLARLLKRLWFHTLAGLILNLFSVSVIAPAKRPSQVSAAADARQASRATRIDWRREFERVDRFATVLTYFTSNTWYFNPETRQRLIKDFMNGEDNRLFNCDTSCIDWRHFGDKIALGLRRYIFEERDESIREARVKYRKTYWRNTALQFLLVSLAFHIVYMLILF